MEQSEIIRMAVKCQLLNASNREGLYAQALERFAALAFEAGAVNEREACAKICENLPAPKNATTLTHIPTLETCAAAIRARGEK